MYILYEHHKDAHGKIVLTEIRLSSDKSKLSINFYSTTEKLIFGMCKTILKFPPVASRSYDDTTKLWSYMEDWGAQVLEKIKATCSSLGTLEFLEVEDIATAVASGYINWYARKTRVPKPEDFFYNTSAPSNTQALSKEQLAQKLTQLLEVSTLPTEAGALKKLYRQAAMRLHPDRNNGNGSKMSELNMYWGLYNA